MTTSRRPRAGVEARSPHWLELDHHWAEVITGCAQPTIPSPSGSTSCATPAASSPAIWEPSTPESSDGAPELVQARVEAKVVVNARRVRWRRGPFPASAQTRLDGTSRTKWGRHDHQGIAEATTQVSAAQRRLDGLRNTEAAARARVSDLAGHQQLRRQMLAEDHPRRTQLKGALEDFDRALDATRPERVNALAADPAAHLMKLLARCRTRRPTGTSGAAAPKESSPTWTRRNRKAPPGGGCAAKSERSEQASRNHENRPCVHHSAATPLPPTTPRHDPKGSRRPKRSTAADQTWACRGAIGARLTCQKGALAISSCPRY